MAESERSHRSGSRRISSTIEFFFCFSSRSSSSMKISSKSILSPGRSREPALSLSTSLSRRLRSNGSMKGGQASPMFPTGSKKKGGSFEPPEPSSPKVTCIGQVRVKSKKKHGRKLRTRSQRRGEVSFRKTEQPQDGIHYQQQAPQECLPHRNQRWVHLPLSICEALRAFGAEFNCFVPCGGRSSSSSCSWTSEREKVEKRSGSTTAAASSSSCGAVFARWLFAMQESEEKGREIDSVVRVEKKENEENREVVHEIQMEMEISEDKTKRENEEEEEEEARESICIPPKNALLLMRSRSAPFRMSSLANRFWDSPAPQDNNEEEAEVDEEGEEEELEIHNTISEENPETMVQKEAVEERDCDNILEQEEETKEEVMLAKCCSADNLEELVSSLKEEEMGESQGKEEQVEEASSAHAEEGEAMDEEYHEIQETGEILVKETSSPDAFEEEQKPEGEEEPMLQVEEKEEVKEVVEKKEERRVSFSSSTIYLEPESETDTEEEDEQEIERGLLEKGIEHSTEGEVPFSVLEEEKEMTPGSTTEQQIKGKDDNKEEKQEEEDEKSLLPECLLLMMCEPKLSMEVSKETWVCSRDFIRVGRSEKKVIQKNSGDESIKKRVNTDSNPPRPSHPRQQSPRQQQHKPQKQVQVQPSRSSFSKVEPLATVVEKKLASAGAYEPFVLKRCKSEPMRNSAKLDQEACFWKTNKLEIHRPPSLGMGATGIGF